MLEVGSLWSKKRPLACVALVSFSVCFRCRTMAHCFERDTIVRTNGTFRYSRKVSFYDTFKRS